MKFLLLSPEKTLFDGEVESVTVPGTKAIFTIWARHAPIITTLEKGTIVYKTANEEKQLVIESGFAEVKNNIISICIEKVISAEAKQ